MIRPMLLILLTVALLASAHAADTRPKLPAVLVSEAPKIDGDLSDSCWSSAPTVSDFVVMDDSSKPGELTTAAICYDQQAIYVYYRCKDSVPGKIVAQQRKRGGNIWNDDIVELDLDCFNDFQQTVYADVTPRGTQFESLQSGDASKIEWRGDWAAAAKRTADGYDVEMAIPFSILQYDPKQTGMGVTFARRHARTNKWWSAPNITTNWDSRKFFLWDGLKLPAYKKRPLVLGYTLLHTGDPGSTAQTGLDMKYAITTKATGVISVNPDFASVEQDVESVDFSYNESYRSDARPFFLEGKSYFPGTDLLYTNRIGAVDYGAKMMGMFGGLSVGAMRVQGSNSDTYDVARISHTWVNKGHLEISDVHAVGDGFDNTAVILGGDRVLLDRNGTKVDMYSSVSSAGAADGSGSGGRFDFGAYSSVTAKKLGWSVYHQQIDPDYNPRLGYISETDISTQGTDLWIWDNPSKGSFRSWNLNSGASTTDHRDGAFFHNGFYLNASCGWRNGTGMGLGWSTGNRRESTDEGADTYYDDHVASISYGWNQLGLYRQGSVYYCLGRQAGGGYKYYSASQGWPLSDSLNIGGVYTFSSIDSGPNAYTNRQIVGTLVYDLDDERTVTGRLVRARKVSPTDDDGWTSNVYLSYRQRVRSGMDVYVLFGDPNADDTRNLITLKLVRPLL